MLVAYGKTDKEYEIHDEWPFEPKSRGSGWQHQTCPKCSASRKKKTQPCMGTNWPEQRWECNHCHWKGCVAEEDQEIKQMPTKREPIADQVQPITPSVLKWLASRGISEATANAFQIKSTTRAGKECAAIPYYHSGKVVNWKYRILDGKQWSASKGGWLCAFNFDMLEPGQILVITAHTDSKILLT